MKTQNLSLYAGDTHIFKVSLSSISGGRKTADEMADVRWKMELRFEDGSYIEPRTTVENGVIHVLFPAHLTAGRAGQTAEYDLRGRYDGVVRTFMRGFVTIARSVSRIDTPKDGVLHENDIDIDVSREDLLLGAGISDKVKAILAGKEDPDTAGRGVLENVNKILKGK